MEKRKIKIGWSCGVKAFCEHKTKFGALMHGMFGIKINNPLLGREKRRC